MKTFTKSSKDHGNKIKKAINGAAKSPLAPIIGDAQFCLKVENGLAMKDQRNSMCWLPGVLPVPLESQQFELKINKKGFVTIFNTATRSYLSVRRKSKPGDNLVFRKRARRKRSQWVLVHEGQSPSSTGQLAGKWVIRNRKLDLGIGLAEAMKPAPVRRMMLCDQSKSSTFEVTKL